MFNRSENSEIMQNIMKRMNELEERVRILEQALQHKKHNVTPTPYNDLNENILIRPNLRSR